MKNALISPNQQVYQVTGYKFVDGVYQPILVLIPNSERVAQVEETTFEVAPPLFWVQCADSVLADQFYYDSVQQTILPIPEPPPIPQPVSSGTQTV
jgi:hypothetical protein